MDGTTTNKNDDDRFGGSGGAGGGNHEEEVVAAAGRSDTNGGDKKEDQEEEPPPRRGQVLLQAQEQQDNQSNDDDVSGDSEEEEEDDNDGSDQSNEELLLQQQESSDDNDDDDDEDYDDNDDGDDDSSYNEEDEEDLMGGTIRQLCERGLPKLAYQRLQMLKQKEYCGEEQEKSAVLQKEIFDVGDSGGVDDDDDDDYTIHVLLKNPVEIAIRDDDDDDDETNEHEDSDSDSVYTTKLVLDIIQCAEEFSKVDTWDMLSLPSLKKKSRTNNRRLHTQHRSSRRGRTALHWGAVCNHDLIVMKALVNACPEALLLKDDQRTFGGRTPLEQYQRYFGRPFDCVYIRGGPGRRRKNVLKRNLEKIDYLQRATQSWIQHRLRLTIYHVVLYYFGSSGGGSSSSSNGVVANVAASIAATTTTATDTTTTSDDDDHHHGSGGDDDDGGVGGRSPTEVIKSLSSLATPFNEQDRQLHRIRPKPWFVMSVLGDLLQREMKPLLKHILSFVGHNAKVEYDDNSKKRCSKTTTKRKKTVEDEEEVSKIKATDKKKKKDDDPHPK